MSPRVENYIFMLNAGLEFEECMEIFGELTDAEYEEFDESI